MLAFRLLAHAELEGFFEFCAETLTDHLSTKNDAGRLKPATQKRLVLHANMVAQYPPKSLTFALLPKMRTTIKGMLSSQTAAIASNNGVSEKDVLKLFVPLGCEMSFFDHAWLSSLNDLAHARGDVAHQSSNSMSAIYQPTPEAERSRLVRPLWGTKNLVDELLKLQRSA